MNTPQVYPLSAQGLVPVYPQTAGITSKGIAKNVAAALEALGELPDPLPDDLRRKYGLCTYDYAIRTIHQPENQVEADLARDRLIFDELLCLSLSLGRLKAGRVRERTAPMPPVDLEPFYRALPFTLTGAQRLSLIHIWPWKPERSGGERRCRSPG